MPNLPQWKTDYYSFKKDQKTLRWMHKLLFWRM